MSIIGEAATAKVNIPEPDYYLKVIHDSDNNVVSADIKLKNVPRFMYQSQSHLTGVRIHDTATSIGSYAFQFCTSLSMLELPASITSIYQYAFQGCTSLNMSELPSSVRSLGSRTFQNTAISISRYGGSVSDYTFAQCPNLFALDLYAITGLSTTSIGDYCFADSSNLHTLIIRYLSVRGGGYNMLRNTNIQHIYVPANLVDSYAKATYWKNYASIIEAIPT